MFSNVFSSWIGKSWFLRCSKEGCKLDERKHCDPEHSNSPESLRGDTEISQWYFSGGFEIRSIFKSTGCKYSRTRTRL